MFKKLLKWIFRFFLLILIIAIPVGIYFYIFPTYPDYEIPEEYFHTRSYEQWFDSPQNGFKEWKKLLESLDEHTDIIWKYDVYYKCFIDENCARELEGISGQEKTIAFEEISWDEIEKEKFGQVIENFLSEFTRITEQYNFVSTLNYADDEDWNFPVGGEDLVYTQLMQLSRWMIFYNSIVSDKIFIENMVTHYKNLSWLSHNYDTSLIGYLVIITLYNIQFDYLENNIEKVSSLFKVLFWNNMKEYTISDSMMENGNISSYFYGKMIFENIFVKSFESANKTLWSSIKTTLFYDHDDTMNVVRKLDYDKSKGVCDFKVVRNGKNFLWRTLLQGDACVHTSQYQKQTELLQKREQLIQLLSN